jgi:hypothetical protein
MSIHYITVPGGIPGVAGVFAAGTEVEVDDTTHEVIVVRAMATGDVLARPVLDAAAPTEETETVVAEISEPPVQASTSVSGG